MIKTKETFDYAWFYVLSVLNVFRHIYVNRNISEDISIKGNKKQFLHLFYLKKIKLF